MKTTDLSSIAIAVALFVGLSQVAFAQSAVYTVENLLEPCVEGDNDSRWGAAAEAECEQYIKGFTDAYGLLRDNGKADNVCLPAQNRLDEIRWAFMRWAHKNFDDRTQPAPDALLAVIKEHFTCT